MEFVPFTKVTNVPNGYGRFFELSRDCDFIDVAHDFVFNIVRGVIIKRLVETDKPDFRAVATYMFDAQLSIDFNASYKLVSVEFRKPFELPGVDGLYFSGRNLFLHSLQEASVLLNELGVSVKKIDVGLESPELGLSFFSSDYEGDLDVRLDAVTIHFK